MTPSFAVRHLPAWVVNGVTVTAGLALVQASIGLAAGAAAAQAAIATAVCASLADVVTTTGRVARRVGVAVIASTLASTLFLAIRPVDALAIPAVALIVLATMLLLSWGPKAGSVSFATGLALVFAMSLPASEGLAWPRLAWGLAGSLGYWAWAVATAWLLQPTWRQFALAATAQDLASLLSAIARQMAQPVQVVWQSDILDAESALAERLQAARDLVFAEATGPDGRRETAILLHLIDLRDLAMASNLEAGLQPATHVQAERTGAVVESIADALRAGGRAPAHRARARPSTRASRQRSSSAWPNWPTTAARREQPAAQQAAGAARTAAPAGRHRRARAALRAHRPAPLHLARRVAAGGGGRQPAARRAGVSPRAAHLRHGHRGLRDRARAAVDAASAMGAC